MLIILLIGFLTPQCLKMPVQGATSSDYHPNSFWFYPWGRSVTHKGVDVFAAKGTSIYSSTKGVVIFQGEIDVGGKAVVVLGPKWRLHYYAHLNEFKSSFLSLVDQTSEIGSVGDSGNAKGKPPHLHYAIWTPFPYVWRIDGDRQGWKKMFYLNPIDYF